MGKIEGSLSQLEKSVLMYEIVINIHNIKSHQLYSIHMTFNYCKQTKVPSKIAG